MKKYNVGVVGIGVVGKEMVRVLEQRKFPVQSLRVFATRERVEKIDGKEYKIEVANDDSFKGMDVVFFAGTEGEKGASKTLGWKAVEQGAFVIDNGDDFRMDPRVPLVVPEVNPQHLSKDKKFIANPNCSTIQMVVALAPLHAYAKIKRVVVSTYQSVSGTGKSALKELFNQSKAILEGVGEDVYELVRLGEKNIEKQAYPHPIAFNLIPQISSLPEGEQVYKGYYKEEIKMVKETRKIMDAPEMAVSATCVRVPVYYAHSETVNVEFEKELSAEKARELLGKAPGVKVVDNPAGGEYPMPLFCAGKDETFVGRIRKDPSRPNSIDMWVVSDNIRKGAALNAVQIAEVLIEKKLI